MLSIVTIATLITGASAFNPPAGRWPAAKSMHASYQSRPCSPAMAAPMVPTTMQLAELMYDEVTKSSVQVGTDNDILVLGALAVVVPVVVTLLGVGTMGED